MFEENPNFDTKKYHFPSPGEILKLIGRNYDVVFLFYNSWEIYDWPDPVLFRRNWDKLMCYLGYNKEKVLLSLTGIERFRSNSNYPYTFLRLAPRFQKSKPKSAKYFTKMASDSLIGFL